MAELSLGRATDGDPGAGELHDPGVRDRVERALRAIPDVVGVRLVPGLERPLDEIHVLTGPGRAPKQVVRDVQSLLFARFGLNIDHRVVSVVQLDEGGPGLRAARPTITRVTAAQHGLQVEVVVTLGFRGEEYEGSALGNASAAGRRRTTARATLEAATPLLGDGRLVDIEGVSVERLLGHEVALTFVQIFGPKGEMTVCGSAMVRGDEADAVARSVLDGLNRALEGPRV